MSWLSRAADVCWRTILQFIVYLSCDDCKMVVLYFSGEMTCQSTRGDPLQNGLSLFSAMQGAIHDRFGVSNKLDVVKKMFVTGVCSRCREMDRSLDARIGKRDA